MAAWYPWIVLLHLSCAIVFVGAVVFEVLVLEGLRSRFDARTMQRIRQGVMARARRFMPWVVALLFLSGFALFDLRCNHFECIGTRFGNWLLLKVLLAFGVLGLFAGALLGAARGHMNASRFHNVHHFILGLMIGIVFLAKAMFVL